MFDPRLRHSVVNIPRCFRVQLHPGPISSKRARYRSAFLGNSLTTIYVSPLISVEIMLPLGWAVRGEEGELKKEKNCLKRGWKDGER